MSDLHPEEGTFPPWICVDAKEEVGERPPPGTLTSVLHNMSMRPRTTIPCSIRPEGETLVRFALRPRSNKRQGRLSRKARTALSERWDHLGLKGAALVFGWAPPAPPHKYERGPELLEATDEALIVNVLGRTRSCLLLGDAPLSLETGYMNRELASDDPRLVALARETGARRWKDESR